MQSGPGRGRPRKKLVVIRRQACRLSAAPSQQPLLLPAQHAPHVQRKLTQRPTALLMRRQDEHTATRQYDAHLSSLEAAFATERADLAAELARLQEQAACPPADLMAELAQLRDRAATAAADAARADELEVIPNPKFEK